MIKQKRTLGRRPSVGASCAQRSDGLARLASSRAGRWKGVFLAALTALACTSESEDDLSQSQKEHSALAVMPKGKPNAAAPAPSKPADKAALTAKAPDAAITADGRRRVWVMMRQKAPVAQSAKKPWKQRGTEVHKSLQDTAKSSQASLLGFLAQKNVEHKSFWAVNTVQVTADDATIQQIARRPDVERIIDGFRASIPKPSPQAAQSIIQEVEWNIAQVRAPEAWADFGIRGEDVVVANIDTGVEFAHPALVNSYRGLDEDGNLVHDYNWHDPSSVCGFPSTAPCDNAGHGTHTMGTIAGDDGGDNQIGVAPGVKWIAAKGCEDFFCSDSALLSSAQWMLAPTDLNGQNPDPSKRPHIVSNSWGGGSGDAWYQEMVQAWVAAGIFPVFASGNPGDFCGGASSPGDYPESYGVGAYDAFDQIAWFSGRGPSAFGVTKPNISAPGVMVRSSVPGGAYEFFDGTSMATPHVAGAVALLWSAAPALAGDVAGTRAILDEAAIDHEDLSCGGTPENNDVWGEGSLDVYAALEAAPIGPTGTLVGAVSSADALGIAGAQVEAVGPTVRRATTNSAGDYSLRLPVGTYDVTASAFGYYPGSFTGIVIDQDADTPLSITLDAAPTHQLDGYVLSSDGTPIFGAEVVVVGTPLPVATTDDAGYFTFGEVPEGTYSVATTAGGCFQGSASEVTITADLTLDTQLPSVVDAYGYQCRPIDSEGYVGEEPLGLTGDDNLTTVSLPFSFTFYGGSYDSVQVTTNGFISFADFVSPTFFNEPIPSVFEPNNAIYGFWDDLYVDDPSQILTATYGSAPERVFVIEYRDVPFYSDYAQRANFQIAIHETGEILLHYGQALTSMALGSEATTGIESPEGDSALQYSHRKAALYEGLSVLYEIPFAGFAEGLVTDANDGAPLAGVTVTAVDAGGSTRSTQTNGDGEYRFQLTEGEYELTAAKERYLSESAAITVVDDGTTVQDFSLESARIEVSPGVIQLLVAQGESRTRTLNLSNTGSLNLDFEVKEAGGARASGVVTTKRQRNANINPNATSARDLLKTGPLGAKPNAAGDVLFSFAPGLPFAWGLGEGDGLWLGDLYTLQNHQFTLDGVPTGLFHSASGPYEWQADMALDTTHGAMCHVGVGGDNGIHCWDQESGEETGAITSGDWTMTSQRGLAYKAQDDSFFIGGWNEGIIYNVQGLSGDSPGEVISSCVMADGSISGLAYNEGFDVLWVATNSWEDFIYEINPYDCTVLAVLNPPQTGSFQGAGLDLDVEGNLWAMAQSPNVTYLVESGVPSFSDVPWLSVAPEAGTVGPGSSTNLTVSINTAGLTPGLYLATLVVQSNAANQPSVRIPVSLVVSGFVKAINAGGDVYVDTTGETWVRPQAHVPGSWGYIQRGKNVSTREAISGTDDPILFQNQHQDPYAYRFDNVPNGVYEVNLHFAEIESKVKMGQRLFDVIIENELVLPAHDIRYEVGLFAADSWQFFIPVTDGRVDVRLIPRGKKPPVVNALRVAHRPDR